MHFSSLTDYSNKSIALKKFTKYHKDGSVWAKGQLKNDVMEGYWEWFRKPARPAGGDGTKMRSGYFKAGKQTGTWTTYDKTEKIVRETNLN